MLQSQEPPVGATLAWDGNWYRGELTVEAPSVAETLSVLARGVKRIPRKHLAGFARRGLAEVRVIAPGDEPDARSTIRWTVVEGDLHGVLQAKPRGHWSLYLTRALEESEVIAQAADALRHSRTFLADHGVAPPPVFEVHPLRLHLTWRDAPPLSAWTIDGGD